MRRVKLTGVKRRLSRLRRWNHTRRGHPVVKTVGRSVAQTNGEFEFYFRRHWLCPTCDVDWPTYT